MIHRHYEPHGVDSFIAEMFDSTTDNFDPVEELLGAIYKDSPLKACTCGGKCDHDRHTVNFTVEHFDKIFEEMMDAEFLQHIMQPIRKATGLISNLMEFEQQADKAAANSKAAKDAKAKETKEEKEKREKYEKHMKKAEELITAKNHKDAITALQQARMYATADKQKEVDEKIAAQKKAMNQGSLFEMMEETPAPAPQVAQPQNVAPQPAQQTIQPQAVPRQMPPQPQHLCMGACL